MGNLADMKEKRMHKRYASNLRRIADRVDDLDVVRSNGSVKEIIEDLLYVVKSLAFMFMRR